MTWHRAARAALVIATPIVLLLLNRNLFIPPGGTPVNPGGNQLIDSWLYTGYMLSLPEHLRQFGQTYYAARLPWLLPGFIAQRTFPPVVANYVVHFSFFCALLLATYLLVRRAAGSSAAMMSTLVMGWSPAVVMSLTWDHPDGAGIVCLVVALLGAECAARAGGRVWPWASVVGASFACQLSLNPTLIALWPSVALFWFLRRDAAAGSPVVLTLAGVAVGFAATLTLFAAVNASLGGKWYFLEGAINFVRSTVGQPNAFRRPGYQWIREAVWLVLPAFATVGAVASLIRFGLRQLDFARTVQVVLLAVVGTWTMLQVMGVLVFEYPIYTAYVVPFALLALPFQGGDEAFPRRAPQALVLGVSAVAVFALAYMVMLRDMRAFWSGFSAVFAPFRGLTPWAASTLWCTIVGCAAVLSFVLLRRPALKWAAFLALFAASFGAVPTYWPSVTDRHTRRLYTDVAAAHRFIEQHRTARPLRMWYSVPPWSLVPFRSIGSSFLWGYVLVNEELPALTRDQIKTLASGHQLVILAETRQQLASAAAALRRFNLDYRTLASTTIDEGDQAFMVVVTEVVDARGAE